MAKIYGQLENAQLHNKSSDPTNLPDGLLWINTTSNVIKAYVGAQKRTVVTTDQTQTLTNKNIDGSLNTLTNLPSSAIVSVQGSGTYASPQAITNGAALAFSGAAPINLWFITGSGGAVALGTSNQIAVPTAAGQFLFIVGGSDTNTVSMADGNGLVLNGPCVLALNKVIGFMSVNTSQWIEIFRS